MTKAQHADYVVKGHLLYWNMLGKMRGNENHHGNINRLSGDIDFIYSINLDGPDYKKEVEEIVAMIKANEIPHDLVITPACSTSTMDICGLFSSCGHFEAGSNSGMAKELHPDSAMPVAPKNLNLYRVKDPYMLKMTGSILNTAFEYSLFSFEHYLDAFNMAYIHFYLAEYNGLPAGACMSIYGDDFVEIAWVGTLNGYRKKGIAGYLMQMAEADAMREGKVIAVLSAFPNAVNAYKRIGYQECCEIKVLHYAEDK